MVDFTLILQGYFICTVEFDNSCIHMDENGKYGYMQSYPIKTVLPKGKNEE